MKHFLTALAMIPSFAFAQNYIAKENNGKLDVYPTKGTISLSRTMNGNSCSHLRMILEQNESSSLPQEEIQKTIDMVDGNKLGADWGTPVVMMPWYFNGVAENELKAEVSADMGRNVSEINVIHPDLEKADLGRKTIVLDESNVFVHALKKYNKGMGTIQVNINGSNYLRVQGRIAYCAFYEKALTVEMTFVSSFKSRKEAPADTVNTLHKYYTDVSSAWKKEENKTWANDMHKLLQIGVILKEKATDKKLAKLINLNEAFDKFFESHWRADEDEGLSIYLNEFRNMSEFRTKVIPDQVSEIKVNGTLTEKDL